MSPAYHPRQPQTILITESNVKPTADHSQADLAVYNLAELHTYFDRQP